MNGAEKGKIETNKVIVRKGKGSTKEDMNTAWKKDMVIVWKDEKKVVQKTKENDIENEKVLA